MKTHFPAPNPNGLFCVLVLINFLNYTDRAILPGSANEFIVLISTSLSTSRPDIYLGFLQSSFIVGFSFASIIISHLVHFRGPFYLCAIGLGLWVISAVLSGIGFYCNNFSLLLLGRMLSGIGEASFVCTVPPWIAKHAPPGQKGRWLAIFYTALPVGTAFGYSYAAFIATTFGVYCAFFMESLAMLPLIAVLLNYAPYYPSCSSAPTEQLQQQELSPISPSEIHSTASEMIIGHSGTSTTSKDPITVDDEILPAGNNGSGSISGTAFVQYVHEESPSMIDELYTVLRSPIYILISCGTACQAAVLCGLGTFGSSFLIGLGYFDSETAASSTFGSVVCLAGVIGTPLGGLLLDYSMRNKDDKEKGKGRVILSGDGDVDLEFEALTVAVDSLLTQQEIDDRVAKSTLKCVTRIIAIATFFGAFFLCIVYTVYQRLFYLFFVTLGCLLVFLCNPCVNIGIMMAVPEKNRSFAIAFTSVCVHIFGDVPSPVITGLLKDLLAPGCSPPVGPPVIPSEGHHSHHGGHGANSSISSLSSVSSSYVSSTADIGDRFSRALFSSMSSDISPSFPSSSSSRTYTTYGGAASSDECRAEGHGLRLTMLIVSLWLFMSVALFGIAWYIAYSGDKENDGNGGNGDADNVDHKHLNIVNIISNMTNAVTEKNEKKAKNVNKKLASKRAYNRLQLNEPLLFLDEENL